MGGSPGVAVSTTLGEPPMIDPSVQKRRSLAMVAQSRLASTVLLLRNCRDATRNLEVFMVRRVAQSEFMPDVYVFPGGSVTGDDCTTERTAGLCASVPTTKADPEGRTALGTGTRAAAIRELFEEANILLAYQNEQMLAVNKEVAQRFAAYRQAFNQREGSLVEPAHKERLKLATDHLAYFAHWITPEGLPKRYDTHFFLAVAPIEQEAVYDQLETSDGMWIEPAVALKHFKEGTFPLAFPTYHQLRYLANYSSMQEALDTTATHYVATKRPLLKDIDGVPHVYLPEDPENTWNIQRG
jgi:8-oxo-dGTP pyrophosphatase MutT (NUDIX family)